MSLREMMRTFYRVPPQEAYARAGDPHGFLRPIRFGAVYFACCLQPVAHSEPGVREFSISQMREPCFVATIRADEYRMEP